jgi:hypothetical protein
MEPRWQSDAYGSRNPVTMLVGTKGWGLLRADAVGQIDLRDRARAVAAVEADQRATRRRRTSAISSRPRARDSRP